MQSIADRLRSVGSDISDQDLILYTLQGLGSEYETFVTAFSMRLYLLMKHVFKQHLYLLIARLHISLLHLSTSLTILPLNYSLPLDHSLSTPPLPLTKGIKVNFITTHLVVIEEGVVIGEGVEADIIQQLVIPLVIFALNGATPLQLVTIDLISDIQALHLSQVLNHLKHYLLSQILVLILTPLHQGRIWCIPRAPGF
jgi:hypothetical protein